MRLDAHQHFWDLSNPFTDWPTAGLASIYRDFGPGDLQEHLASCAIDGTILVQAAPSVEETEYCLSLAGQHDFVKGVVGWIDFEADDALPTMERLARNPLLKGLRPMVQSIEEPNWLLKSRLEPVFSAMCDRGLRLDGLVLSHQIPDLDELARRHPALPVILDHGGKPPMAAGGFADWAKAISSLASNHNVYCKLSGLWTEAGGDISQSNVQPWVDHLLEAFGPSRLVWGSDWPVLEIAGTYLDWFSQCQAMLSELSPSDLWGVFGANGRRFYGVE